MVSLSGSEITNEPINHLNSLSRSPFVLVEAGQSLPEDLRPLAIEGVPVPLETGSGKKANDDVSDIVMVRLEIMRIAIKGFLDPSDACRLRQADTCHHTMTEHRARHCYRYFR
jgi:hypothetical protein